MRLRSWTDRLGLAPRPKGTRSPLWRRGALAGPEEGRIENEDGSARRCEAGAVPALRRPHAGGSARTRNGSDAPPRARERGCQERRAEHAPPAEQVSPAARADLLRQDELDPRSPGVDPPAKFPARGATASADGLSAHRRASSGTRRATDTRHRGAGGELEPRAAGEVPAGAARGAADDGGDHRCRTRRPLALRVGAEADGVPGSRAIGVL